ncbi:unnamed protein product [Musa banksii]
MSSSSLSIDVATRSIALRIPTPKQPASALLPIGWYTPALFLGFRSRFVFPGRQILTRVSGDWDRLSLYSLEGLRYMRGRISIDFATLDC